MFCESGGDFSEYARFVFDAHSYEITAYEVVAEVLFVYVVAVFESRVLRFRLFRRKNDVADDCASRGEIARASAVKHNVADVVALNEHRVKTAFNRCQGVVRGDESRVNARFDFSVVGTFGYGEKF